MERSSLGVRVLIFFGGFRSNTSCTCAAASTVMLFKQAKLGHVISLLRPAVVSPVTQAKAHTRPAKALIIHIPVIPAPWSHPPALTPLHPHQPCFFLGHVRSSPISGSFCLLFPLPGTRLPLDPQWLAPQASLNLGSNFQCELAHPWVRYQNLTFSARPVLPPHSLTPWLLSKDCVTHTSSCFLPLLMVYLSSVGCEPHGGREFYSPQSPQHLKQCLAQ